MQPDPMQTDDTPTSPPQAGRGWLLLVLLPVLVFLAACTDSATHPALNGAALPPLLQASDFITIAPEPNEFRLSPDGRKIAWLGAHYGRTALHVRDIATDKVRHFPRVTHTEQWTADGRWLLYHAPDRSGAENTHVYAIDTEGPGDEPFDLTPQPNVKARLHQLLPAEPGVVLVAHNRRDARLFDLYRIDLATRKETLVSRNPGDAVAPLTDATGNLRGWQRSREARRPPDERARPLAERKPTVRKRRIETFQVLGPSADGASVWALSNRGRDRIALVSAHPTLGWERVEFEDPHVDVTEVDMSHVQRKPFIARALPGHPRFEILDAKLRDDLAALLAEQGTTPFTLRILSTDAKEERMIVVVRSTSSRRYFLFDRARRTHTLLSEVVPASLQRALVPIEPVVLAASDGMELRGYLALPQGVAPKNLPLVLLVHGGPWQRSAWGDPLSSDDAMLMQFLANRGYAVLEIDFRGSTGYGQRLLYAAVGEFAGRMQEDLHDAARWAIDRGIADAGRVALFGWSYGGYATMTGLTRTPQEFACGVSLNGPTDLAPLIEAFPAYWQVDLSMWHDFVGNPKVAEDRADMTRKSPLTHAARMERPLLLIHGAKDVRVQVDQAERMVAALRAANRPVEYLRIEDMGHTAGWWVHRMKVLRATERFLHGCMGGRASRLDPWDPVAWTWERVKR
jgi:dipeptidyl aminopeptidase/acylaminoacyl peptidase